MAWLIDYNGNFTEHVGTVNEKIVDFISRLQTIKGEQSFNGGNGLDFIAILEGRKYSQIEIDKIARDYAEYFTVKVEKTQRDIENRALLLTISLKVKNSEELENINFNILLGTKK